QAGELPLERAETDVGALIRRVADDFAPLAQGRSIALRTQAQDGLPAVSVDSARISQVLANLLSNAVRYAPEGGEIAVEARLNGGPDSSGVEISVRDNGPGISAEDLPHVFERFYRADRSRSRAGGGTGLGLAIAKELVEAHGGRIWAESEPDRGSRFAFTIPTN
ncbi:MAG: cell wall metabolism sensor histidine kinase WalK, partial [Chloroflexi bacterium]|nr:cell wall metabolism sensor histidine kinase WalK [Chloroflexota bacterium]